MANPGGRIAMTSLSDVQICPLEHPLAASDAALQLGACS